MIKPQQRWS